MFDYAEEINSDCLPMCRNSEVCRALKTVELNTVRHYPASAVPNSVFRIKCCPQSEVLEVTNRVPNTSIRIRPAQQTLLCAGSDLAILLSQTVQFYNQFSFSVQTKVMKIHNLRAMWRVGLRAGVPLMWAASPPLAPADSWPLMSRETFEGGLMYAAHVRLNWSS